MNPERNTSGIWVMRCKMLIVWSCLRRMTSPLERGNVQTRYDEVVIGSNEGCVRWDQKPNSNWKAKTTSGKHP